MISLFVPVPSQTSRTGSSLANDRDFPRCSTSQSARWPELPPMCWRALAFNNFLRILFSLTLPQNWNLLIQSRVLTPVALLGPFQPCQTMDSRV